MLQKLRHAINWFIRDKNGRVQVFQFPNLPIIAWFGCMVVNLLTKGVLQSSFSQLSLIFLSIWSYLEITSGASYFRRTLGFVIAVLIISNVFS
jgi:hypothetical protein